MANKAKTTMRDVAEAAEVSATTVWMVIHNKTGIADETVKRVWSTIEALNYNVKSGTDNQQVTTSVGLLIEHSTIPAISDVFYGDVIRGFQAEAEQLGYHVVLSVFDRSTNILDHIESSLIQNVSGFVVANDGDITPETLVQIQKSNVPVVLVESYIDGYEIPCILGDNFMAGYKVTRHMLALGHEKIAILRGPQKYSSLVDRWRGCLAALAEQGILTPPMFITMGLSISKECRVTEPPAPPPAAGFIAVSPRTSNWAPAPLLTILRAEIKIAPPPYPPLEPPAAPIPR
jgi:LacI family transcriptional regulator